MRDFSDMKEIADAYRMGEGVEVTAKRPKEAIRAYNFGLGLVAALGGTMSGETDHFKLAGREYFEPDPQPSEEHASFLSIASLEGLASAAERLRVDGAFVVEIDMPDPQTERDAIDRLSAICYVLDRTLELVRDPHRTLFSVGVSALQLPNLGAIPDRESKSPYDAIA